MLRIVFVSLLLALAPSQVIAWTGCGLEITLPEGWRARLLANNPEACEIGAFPAEWAPSVERARWPEEPYAVRIVVFSSQEDAELELGFERIEGTLGINGRQGAWLPAESFSTSQFTGWRGGGWFRGFAKAGTVFPEDESPLFSGWRTVYLLCSKNGRVVGVEYYEGNPDVAFELGKPVASIVESLRPEGAPN